MGTTDVALERVFRQLTDGNAGLTIAELETYLAAWPNAQTSERLRNIKEEYTLLADYWQMGVSDPQREQHYQNMLQRLYVLAGNIAIFRHRNASSFLHSLYASVRQQGTRWSLDEVRKEMENFVSNIALLELEPEQQREEKRQALYKDHQQALNRLFNFVVTSSIWTDSVGSTMEQLLLTPTIDSMDQQLLTSAITLSLMNRFDMAKFRTLVKVYLNSYDEHVRQRALVGWALSIDDDFLKVYPDLIKDFSKLLESKRICNELTELQIQLIYTLNAERDKNTMQEEIIPELMKNQNLTMTDHGLVEREEDELEEALHPEASEERMERLESTFRRMQQMQRQGSDIFFSGFSHMKRYPFFYDMSNWLMPFYMQHPDIQQFLQRLKSTEFLERITSMTPFCNSDKYSFVIAFQEVITQLPEKMRKMLEDGEASFGAEEVDEETQQQPAYIRRCYLMDLYRFFRLFPNRQALINPFDTSKDRDGNGNAAGLCLFLTSVLFENTPMDERKMEVLPVLKKHQMKNTLHRLLNSIPFEKHDLQYYFWKEDYKAVLEIDPDNERALLALGRQAFRLRMFDEALDYFEHLLLLQPEKKTYQLNKAVCQTHLDDYEEALQVLYRLNYEEPDNVAVLRALAWTLLCADRIDQATDRYAELTSKDDATSEDWLNQGYTQWIAHNIKEAVDSFKKSMELSGNDPEDFWLIEYPLLRAHDISDIDVALMRAMVLA